MTSAGWALEYESGPPIERGRLAVWLLVAAEAMFFAGLLSAWFVLRSGVAGWPAEPRASLPMGIAFTALLGVASLTAASAARVARAGAAGPHRKLAERLVATATAGAAFLALQAYEYAHLVEAGATPRTDVAYGAFYLLTACHGLHVLAGVVWSLALAVLALRGGEPEARRRRVEYGVLYQHFVDVVWVALFVALYVVG